MGPDMRTPLVAGNWKMNTNLAQAVDLVEAMRDDLARVNGVEVVLCPPFISLARVGELLRGTAIGLGAQDMHYEEKGAYTGEVSPLMLQGLCRYVILGHSERRHYFAESDEVVNRKVKAALRADLRPILCVGERLEQREAGQVETVISHQVRQGLDGVAEPDGLVVAYEPVWAIGTGRAATGGDAQAVTSLIRRLLAERFGGEAAQAIRILYGGSVTPDNIVEFATQPDIDGALVGGASLRAADFVGIVERTARARGAG